jgi:hypothetical protein
VDYSETSWRLIIYEKKIMKKNFGRHVIKIYGFFVFSVYNYFKTNAASVVFGSTPPNEINILFVKKKFEIMIFWPPNLDFSRKKT